MISFKMFIESIIKVNSNNDNEQYYVAINPDKETVKNLIMKNRFKSVRIGINKIGNIYV